MLRTRARARVCVCVYSESSLSEDFPNLQKSQSLGNWGSGLR